MPISHHKCVLARQEGFSLLEMLVVLAITGVVLSIVSIRLVSSIESTRFVKTAEMAVADIKLIRLQAIFNKKSVKIIGANVSEAEKTSANITIHHLNLPNDWTVAGDDILISTTGFCSGGYITIKDQTGRRIKFNLMPPTCDAERMAL